ncbi:MAG: AI-2E family transporter [Deltaproteobacteria bacterium]|nr:AI-2E family transporter [Deltaproteobacteria bacterium]
MSEEAPRPEVIVVPQPVVREGAPRSRTLAWLRRFAKLWGFALFCIFIVYTFREVALPFLFAILVAYILSPVVDRFERFKIRGKPFPRGLAVIILYVNIIAVLSVFIGYFIPKLSGDFARMFRETPQLIARANREWVPRAGAWIDERFGAEEPIVVSDPPSADEPTTSSDPADAPESTLRPSPWDRHQHIIIEQLPDGKMRVDLQSVQLEVKPQSGGGYLISQARSEKADSAGVGKWERSIKDWIAERMKSTEGETRRALEWGQKFVAAVVGGVARLVLVLMVAAFILVDMRRLRLFLRSLVPPQYQTDYDRIIVGVDRGLSGVIRGQLLICLINGVFTYAGLLLFTVKYPLLLAGLAAAMSLIPIFGSVLSSIPIVAIALISSGTFDIVQGVKVLAWIIGIHQVEANFLNPKIMGDAAKIHPVLVVFALIAGEHSYGLVGALFAVPMASIIQTMFVYFRKRRQRPTAAPLSSSSSLSEPPPSAPAAI